MIETNGLQSVWNYLRGISNTDGHIAITFIFILNFALWTQNPLTDLKFNYLEVAPSRALNLVWFNSVYLRMCNKSKPGLVLLYGSYSCSRAQTIIFIIRCTALLSSRRFRGPTMRLFVDISWTFPKSSLFTEERSCWFPETTRSFINNNNLHQAIEHNKIYHQLLLFQILWSETYTENITMQNEHITIPWLV